MIIFKLIKMEFIHKLVIILDWMMQEIIIIKRITSIRSIVTVNAIIIYFDIYFIIINLICLNLMLIIDLRIENFNINYSKLC